MARLLGILGEELKIVPIPGSSALTALASVSGLQTQNLVFLGYPPTKKGRKTFFEKMTLFKEMPKVLYESPYRIVKTIDELAEQSVDELMTIRGMTEKQAGALIMKARESWFQE